MRKRFNIDADIAKARTPDTSLYTDLQLFEEIKEKLFVPSWQFVGDRMSIPTPGDAHPLTILENFLDEPVVLVNDQQILRLLSNVCTHRGNLVVGEPCRLAHLRCRYHGRLWHLDGVFRSMPEFKEVQDFPTEADNLKQLPLQRWGPWLFSSLDPAQPFEVYWGEIMKRLYWLPLDRYRFRPELSRDFTVNANWALYCENYLEGFHIPFVHAGLNTVIDFGNYTTELFGNANLQLGIAKEGEEVFELPADSPDHGKKVAAYYFFIFPNLMFNFYPWGLSINIVKPQGLSRTTVSFLCYVADEARYNKGAGSGLDTVEEEDEEVVEAVQKGVRSRFYGHGRYSVTREQGTHHFHRLIDHYLG